MVHWVVIIKNSVNFDAYDFHSDSEFYEFVNKYHGSFLSINDENVEYIIRDVFGIECLSSGEYEGGYSKDNFILIRALG